MEETDLVVGVVEEGEAVQVQVQGKMLRGRELGRTRTRLVGGTIIAREGTIKKWLGLALVLQLENLYKQLQYSDVLQCILITQII